MYEILRNLNLNSVTIFHLLKQLRDSIILVPRKLTNQTASCAICNVYKMSGRSVSVCTDTSASHEYLCTLTQNGHEFCELLIKRPQSCFQITFKKSMLKT